MEICVIGAGPRGISVLERLCAQSRLTSRPVRVHLVDPFLANGGQVWRTGQSRVLLMNTVACQITVFTDDSVALDGPVVPGPSLFEWSRFLTLMSPETYPEHVLEEARQLGPNSYPTRGFYGYYLAWVLRRLVQTAPSWFTVRTHRTTAVAVDDVDGTQTVTLLDGGTITGLDAVVLALGHVDMEPHGEEWEFDTAARVHGLRYVPPGNPADANLESLRPGEPVAVRGLGLNFFDHVALLTEGRGGEFVRVDGRLVYRPSGREPVLHAGSRRGIPYHARGENEKGVSGRHEPLLLTPAVINGLLARAPLNFMRDVWPLVSREVQAVYYSTLLRERHCACDAKLFLSRYTALPVSTSDSALLDSFGIEPADRWDWERVARPFRGGDFQAWLVEQLRADCVEARRGNVSSPTKAALDAMRDLRNEIRLLVDHGGLVGESYRDELQAWYTPLNAFVSIGPPVSRIEELVALMEAGIVRMLGPGLRVSVGPNGFRASGEGGSVETQAFIDARLPEVDVRRTRDPLLRYLMGSGQCRSYRIGAVETGGLAVTRRPYHVVDAAGRAHPRRYAFGVPTETVHWVTAAGIRPGVNSVTLADADAIARAVLEPVRVLEES